MLNIYLAHKVSIYDKAPLTSVYVLRRLPSRFLFACSTGPSNVPSLTTATQPPVPPQTAAAAMTTTTFGVSALYRLANIYFLFGDASFYGDGAARNKREGIISYIKGAQLGHARCLHRLARLHDKDMISAPATPQELANDKVVNDVTFIDKTKRAYSLSNITRSTPWYEEASKADDVAASSEMLFRAATGFGGVPRDRKQALIWGNHAAQQV
jgi:TPR repeat protein